MKEIFDFNSNSQLTWLILASVLFLLVALVLVLAIFILQLTKTNRRKKKSYINEVLNEWLAEVLMDDTDEIPEMPVKLATYFKKRANHSFIIKRLINLRKNISGNSLEKIIKVYESTGLKSTSVRKFRSVFWHKKATGIFELYMMRQADLESEISGFTNSRNEFVRMESQTAVISFSGFAGLEFLGTLSKPITGWQQLKLIEQLNVFSVEYIANLATWLTSENKYVVLFALKLAANFQQLHVHDDVVRCLTHEDENIRAEAIRSLGRISNLFTAAVLVKHYPAETEFNKRNILSALFLIAGDEEQDFLLKQLYDHDDELKIMAASVLFNNYPDGEDMLREKALGEPKMFESIYYHVRRELLA